MARKYGKRRRLMAGAAGKFLLGVAKGTGKRIYKEGQARLARGVFDSASSAVRNAKKKIQQAASRIRKRKSPMSAGGRKIKRKLTYGSIQEGQTMKLAKRNIIINLGGKGQVTRIPKVVRPLWTKVIQQCIASNSGSVNNTTGKLALRNIDNVGNNLELPLHAYDLTYNGDLTHNYNNEYFGWEYKSDGQWQTLNGQDADLLLGPTHKAIEQGHGASTNRCVTWLHKAVKIKLLLYGRTKSSTTYHVVFFRCPHAETTIGQVGSEGRKAELFKNFWHRYLMRYTTNPVNVAPNILAITGQADKKPQILKTFTFNIKEQLSTEDARQKVNVDFYIKLNKVKMHAPDEGFQALDDISNVNEVTITDQSYLRNAQKSCHATQRVYMAIMATNYEITTDANYEAPTYDVSFQTTRFASELMPQNAGS